MQALGDDDKASIEQTIDDDVLQRQGIEFRSTAVQTTADGSRISVQGELTLVGKAGPIAIDLTVGDGGKLSGSAVVKQTDWGITPYSALFGALKVADEVEVVIDATCRRADPGHVAEGPGWSVSREIEGGRRAPRHRAWAAASRASSGRWFFLFLWLGMAAVGVSHGTALPLALVVECFIFLFIRAQGTGRHDPVARDLAVKGCPDYSLDGLRIEPALDPLRTERRCCARRGRSPRPS